MSEVIPFDRRRNQTSIIDFNIAMEEVINNLWNFDKALLSDNFKLDVKEDEEEYTIEAEVPGVNREEISIDFNDSRLTITVCKEKTNEKETKKYLHKERLSGTIRRSVYLRYGVADGIKAKLENGLLKIRVEKDSDILKKKKINIE